MNTPMFRFSAERAKYLNTVLYLAPLLPLRSPPRVAKANKPLKIIASFPTTGSTPTVDLSFLSQLFAPSALREDEVGSGGDPPPRAARGKKDCGRRRGVDEVEGGCWRGESEKREERARGRSPSPLSSISDKNKVNGEWCYRRGSCCRRRGQRRRRPGRVAGRRE